MSTWDPGDDCLLTGCRKAEKSKEPHHKTSELPRPWAHTFHSFITSPLALLESSRKQPVCFGGERWGKKKDKYLMQVIPDFQDISYIVSHFVNIRQGSLGPNTENLTQTGFKDGEFVSLCKKVPSDT